MIPTGIIKRPQNETAAHPKDDKILSKVCPDMRFANNRIAKLNTRKTYETNSIKTSSGARANGAPGGKNKLRKCLRFFKIPIILIPIKIASAILNVTMRWDVTVKL